MLRGKNQIIFYFGIFLIFIFLLTITNLPIAKNISVVNIESDIGASRELILEFPRKLWVDENGKIRLVISKEFIADPINNEKINNQQESSLEQNLITLNTDILVNLEVDLVLSGAIIEPKGILITPLKKDLDVTFDWKVEPIGSEDIIGSIWLYYNFIPENDDEPINRELMYTKELFIEQIQFIGISKKFLNWTSLLILIVTAFVIFRTKNIYGVFGNSK
jgi:hypothetical protein